MIPNSEGPNPTWNWGAKLLTRRNYTRKKVTLMNISTMNQDLNSKCTSCDEYQQGQESDSAFQHRRRARNRTISITKQRIRVKFILNLILPENVIRVIQYYSNETENWKSKRPTNAVDFSVDPEELESGTFDEDREDVNPPLQF